jgi:HKD family nuclease
MGRFCGRISLKGEEMEDRSWNLKRYWLVGLIFIFVLSCWALQAEEVRVLEGKEYFEVLHKALQEAKDSIYVEMYIIITKPDDPENPVSILVDDLIQAKGKGVEVKVVIEDTKFVKCYNAFSRLKEAGVDVRLDSSRTFLHSKAVIIDGKISIVGSTNWSKAAICYNQEASVLIESREVAKRLVKGFLEIKLREDMPLLPQKLEGIKIPISLLTSENRLPRLFSARSEKALDLYLVLLRKSEEENSYILPIDYEELAKALHYVKPKDKKLKPSYTKRFYYLNVSQILNKLKKKTGLVKHKFRAKSLEVIIPEAEGDSFILPYKYWEYGLDRRLSFGAKYMYLVSLAEAENSKRNPYWYRSQKDLSRFYHISEGSLTRAISELERENILEVYRYLPKEKGKFHKRLANRYRMNPLVSEEEFEKRLKALIDKFGRKITLQAQELSAQLNEPKDLEDIEVFINLIKKYGYKRVREANQKTAGRRRELGFQDISWTIRLLKE